MRHFFPRYALALVTSVAVVTIFAPPVVAQGSRKVKFKVTRQSQVSPKVGIMIKGRAIPPGFEGEIEVLPEEEFSMEFTYGYEFSPGYVDSFYGEGPPEGDGWSLYDAGEPGIREPEWRRDIPAMCIIPASGLEIHLCGGFSKFIDTEFSQVFSWNPGIPYPHSQLHTEGTLSLTGDCGEDTYSHSYLVRLTDPNARTNEGDNPCAQCESGGSGGGENHSDSFGSGSSPTTGGPAGPIQTSIPLASSADITPSMFLFQPSVSGWNDGPVNGIRTITFDWGSRVEIEAVGSGSVVRIYDDPTSGAAPTHIREYSRVTDPVLGSGLRLAITDAGTTTTRDRFLGEVATGPNGTVQAWKVVTNGSEIEEGIVTKSGTVRTEDIFTRVDTGSGTIDTGREFYRYETFAWGEELVEKSEGLGAEAVVTTYQQLDSPPNLSGRESYWSDTTGAWERSKYDTTTGRLTYTLRPWLDGPESPEDADETNCHATKYVSDSVTEVYIGNFLVSRSETAKVPIVAGTALQTAFDVPQNSMVVQVADTEKSAAGTRVSYSYYVPKSPGSNETGDFLGTLSGSHLSIHRSVKGYWNAENSTFVENPSGPASCSISTEGTLASPLGEAHKTTRTLTYSDHVGTRRTDLEVYTGGSAYALLSRTDYTYDPQGRLETTIRDGDVVSSTVYNPDGSRTVTGLDGSSVTHSAEVPGSEDSSEIWSAGGFYPSIVTTTDVKLAASSSTTSRSVSAGGMSVSSNSTSTPSGRLTSSTDELGRTTIYSPPSRDESGQTTETETGPGGVTRITTRHRDGQIKSSTGSGVIPEHYSYEIVPNFRNGFAAIATTVKTGGSDSPRWTRTISDTDGLVLQVERPLPGGRTFVEANFYDSQGRLTKNTRTGLADELTVYDSLGNPYRRGLDLDGNGSLVPASADRISETARFYVEEGPGNWWELSTTSIYLTDDSDAPTELSRSKRRFGLGDDELTVSIRADGTTVTTSTDVNRASGTTTITSQSTASSQPAVSVYRYGRLHSQSSVSVSEPVVYGYDALGRVDSITDPRTGLATQIGLNAAGQQLSVTRPDPDGSGPLGPLVTEYGYYPTDHANAGELHWSEDGLNKRTYRAYNTRGQLTHQWGLVTYPLRHLYDVYGAMTGLHTWREGDAGAWDGESVPAAFGASAPDITTWIYDPASGLLLQKKDHTGRGPIYTYRDSGLLHKRIWARGITTTYGWTGAGELQSVTYSDGTPGVGRTYRRDGSLATVTDAAGTTTYGYNGSVASSESIQGELLDGLTLSYPQSQGRRQSFTATLGGNTVSSMGYGYDDQGRLDEVSEPGIGTGGFTALFGYIPDSDLPFTTTSKAGATTVLTGTRGYDDADRLTSIGYARPGNAIATSHGYILDAADRRTRATREDGTAWSYGYNDRDEVTSAVKLLPGEELLAGWQQTFGYDNLGNRTSTFEGGDATGTNRRETVYEANALNQYTEITHPGAFDVLGRAPADVAVTVNGDAVGRQGEFWRREVGDLPNALSAVWQPVQVDAVDPGAGPNGEDVPARRSGHQFVPTALEAPVYDLDGNLLSDSRWNYGWNGENQLTEVTTAAPALAAGVPRERYRYVYDGRSRRIARTVESWNVATQAWLLEKSERFVYDDWNVVAVVDAGGAVLQRYAWGNDLSGTPQGAGGVGGLLSAADVPSGRIWCFAYDGNGNVSAVVDLADGAKVGRYDYDAFGRTIASWGDEELAGMNPYRFSTKPLDGTGLYYYGFRYYAPDTGRWASRDSIEEMGGENLYGILQNNGVSKIDFLGMAFFRITEVEIFAQIAFHWLAPNGNTPFKRKDDERWNHWMKNNDNIREQAKIYITKKSDDILHRGIAGGRFEEKLHIHISQSVINNSTVNFSDYILVLR